METKKNKPDIFFENVIVEKIDFERTSNLPDYLFDETKFDAEKLSVKSTIERAITQEKNRLAIRFKVEIFLKDELEKKAKSFHVICAVIGFFSERSKVQDSMTLEQFALYNAPAFVLPYVREAISDITMRAGMKPIMLPPINVFDVVDRVEKKDKNANVGG